MLPLGPHAYRGSGNQLPLNWGSYLFCHDIKIQIAVYGARYMPDGTWLIFYH